MHPLVGRRVRLAYDDHNEDFARLLPVEGLVERRCATIEGVEDWFLVTLDAPLFYQAPPDRDRLVSTPVTAGRVLIRSRWRDTPIAEGAETSVFLLLVAEGHVISDTRLDVTRHLHVCWALCRVPDRADGPATRRYERGDPPAGAAGTSTPS